jgi:DNA-binding GntR family transcriptional regulator
MAMNRPKEVIEATGVHSVLQWRIGSMPTPRTKLSRRPLYDELAELVRNMIISGQLVPGHRIPERALCIRFGVSRTPLREALKVLSAERLVRLSPNKGATVACITPKEAEDLIAVLGILEAFAGEVACAVIDERTVADIRALHNRMVEHFRRDEKRAYIELNHAIHETIIKATGNQVLIEVHQMLETRISRVLSVVRKPPIRWSEAVEDHERMMEALETQEAATFALVARQHIQHKVEAVREALEILKRKSRAKRIREPWPKA